MALSGGFIRQCENAWDFVQRERGFLGTAKHFLIRQPGAVLEHHILVRATFYEDVKVYVTEMLTFAASNTTTVSLDKFQFAVHGYSATFISGNKHYYDLLERGWWFLVINDRYPQTQEAGDDAWRKALSYVGAMLPYNLLTYNCEHFVTQALLSEPDSRQTPRCILQ